MPWSTSERRSGKPPSRHHPSPSPTASPRRAPSRTRRRSSFKRTATPAIATKPVDIMKRCSSAPGLLTRSGGVDDDGSVKGDVVGVTGSCDYGILFRRHTYTDVFVSSSYGTASSSSSPRRFEVYGKDAKVVVNVTVEGSPGPIRTMVKLGCSIEDTIKAVVDRYSLEGRTPKFDRDATNGFELHHSHFSLQSLDKSELIGDVGSRSFYLRTSGNNSGHRDWTSLGSPEISPGPRTNPPPAIPPLFMVSTFFAHKLSKIMRRARKLWRLVICSQ